MGRQQSVVGLETVAGEMTPVSRFYQTVYNDNTTPDQSAPMNGWLTQRGSLSDWITSTQSEIKSLVGLQKQVWSLGAHPLFMAVYPSVVGLETVGEEQTLHSRWWETNRYYLQKQTGALRDDNMEDLWDGLATEDGAPLCTEDTAEMLGVTVGGGVAHQAAHMGVLVLGGGWWKCPA